jgi:hypothetical protein
MQCLSISPISVFSPSSIRTCAGLCGNGRSGRRGELLPGDRIFGSYLPLVGDSVIMAAGIDYYLSHRRCPSQLPGIYRTEGPPDFVDT